MKQRKREKVSHRNTRARIQLKCAIVKRKKKSHFKRNEKSVCVCVERDTKRRRETDELNKKRRRLRRQ